MKVERIGFLKRLNFLIFIDMDSVICLEVFDLCVSLLAMDH